MTTLRLEPRLRLQNHLAVGHAALFNRLSALTLAITSGASTMQPTFNTIFPDIVQVGDVITLQQSTSVTFASVTTFTHTITVTDIANGYFAYGNSALVNGTYYFRAKQTRSGIDITQWSNTASITLTDTAANITSAATDSVAGSIQLAHGLTADKSVSWSITGGVDAAQFSISGATLRWVGNGTQNYFIPADSDADNVYLVQVTATTAGGTATTQNIAVTVTAPVPSLLRPDSGFVLRADGGHVLIQ